MKKSAILPLIRQSLSGAELDFTTGSIRLAIVLLAIPMVLEMAMESLFAVVDIFFVSKIGVEAAATIGLTESVLTLVYSLAWGLAGAATAIVARRIGEKNREKAAEAGGQAILLGICLAVLIGLPGYFYAEELLRWMGGSAWVVREGSKFTKIMFGSNIVIMLLFLNNGILRGAGDASTAMRALWLANGINIILDPILIFGVGKWAGFGIEGAAIATTIGRGIGVLYQFRQFYLGKIIKIRRIDLAPVLSIIKNIIKVGSGTAGQFLIASGSWVFLMKIVSSFGSEIVAGYTISIRILIFSILPSWGLANAAATLVGQNLGAKKPERAEASAWQAGWWNMYFLMIIAFFSILFAPFLVGLFSQNPTVIESGALSLRVLCAGYVFYGWGMVMAQALNGAGDSFTPTVLNVLCFWCCEIPLAWFLAKTMSVGPLGVYLAVVISESILALLCIYYFKKGRWKSVVV
jgi:putative MATE family efflux protein